MSRDKGGNWQADKKGGPPTRLRVISPISNLRTGGKVRKAGKKRTAERRKAEVEMFGEYRRVI